MSKQASIANVSVSRQAPPIQAGAVKRGKGRWLILPVLLLGMVLGGLSGKYWIKGQASQQYAAASHDLQALLQESRAGLEQAHTQLAALQGQLAVEVSTRKGLEASLQAAQAELGRAHDQLAFFNQLLPPGPAGSISVRALDIEQLGPTLQYKVLLMRNGAEGKPFKGLMQFVAKGSRQGKTVKIELQAATLPANGAAVSSSTATVNGLELNFEQFQRSGGLLSLPEGFTPQTITLNVLEGDTVRLSRTVNLPAAD
ncbi:hypothetical protein H0A66_14005 [Alcaligenaceae bacterium]|nr:hypothetical protein [Alcaligenaceae bacterium]